MKKLLSSFLTAMVLILVCFPVASFAKAIFNIAVSPTTLSLARNTSGSFNVTVTNVSGASFAGGLTYTANILTPTLFTSSMGASTCGASLGNGQSCSFTVNVQAGATTGTDNLAPRVCFLQEACTSLPSTNFAHVTVIRTPPGPTLISITIIPLSGTTLLTGAVQPYTATGLFSDGSTSDITSSVTWVSPVSSIATITSAGVVTAVSAGGTTVRASQGSVSATNTLTVKERFAYIANNSPANSVTKCSIAGSDLINCSASNPDGTFSEPSDVKLNAAGTVAYIVNKGNSTVSQCSFDSSTGVFTNCSASNPPGANFSDPSVLALTPTGNFAYVTNLASGSVSICSIAAGTGALTNCSNTALGFSPDGIAVKPSGDFAYIADRSSTEVIRCVIDSSTGALNNCISSGAIISFPSGIAFNNLGNFIYVSGAGTTVTKCNVDSTTGLLSLCVDTTDPSFTDLRGGLVLDAANSFIDVVNSTGSTIAQCGINPGSGALTTCTVLSNTSTLNFPIGISLK